MRMTLPFAAAFVAGLALTAGSASAASAIQKECSTKYQAAKAANTLNGLTYNQYYKQCAAEAKTEKAGTTPAAAAPATPAAAPAAPAPTPAAAPAPKPAPAPTTTAAKPAKAPAAASASGAVLPSVISPAFASQTPHLGRLHTCAEQWKTNKANNANGSLKWPAYYSECNTHLKG